MSGLPTVLYKFLRTEYAEGMGAHGTVQVGTLFEFRTIESDSERGDSGEGKLQLHSDPGRRDYNSTAELPPVLRGQSIHCGPGGFATDGENAVALAFDGPNMLIYCTTLTFDGSAPEEWGGSCVRIADPERFFRALDATLRIAAQLRGLRLGPGHAGSCSYIDRRHNWHRELPPHWLLKPERYRHQSEFRAAWTVEGNGVLEALIVSSPDIAAACRVEDVTRRTPGPHDVWFSTTNDVPR